jgi:hypothetical protein
LYCFGKVERILASCFNSVLSSLVIVIFKLTVSDPAGDVNKSIIIDITAFLFVFGGSIGFSGCLGISFGISLTGSLGGSTTIGLGLITLACNFLFCSYLCRF